MAEKTIAVTNDNTALGAQAPSTREPGRYVAPLVDIFETPEGLTLLADLPGVTAESIKVNLENNILTIEATPEAEQKLGEMLSREFEVLPFYRAFELNGDIDQDKITAELKNGVLTLKLPKSEAARPRQIPVAVK
ncbi:MAG: Hsp20/alpha crystallin family protein [Candidatus Sumerlaeia bacterium]